jgi:hypothetical protein
LYDQNSADYDRATSPDQEPPFPTDPSPEAAPPAPAKPGKAWPGRFSKTPPVGCKRPRPVRTADGKVWARCASRTCSVACAYLAGQSWHGAVMRGAALWPHLAPNLEVRISPAARLGQAEFKGDATKALRIMRDRPGGFPHLGYWHFATWPHIHLLARQDDPDPDGLKREFLAALERVRPGAYRSDRVHVALIKDLNAITADIAEITPAKVPGLPPKGFEGRLTLASRQFYPKGIQQLEREAERAESKKRAQAYAERKLVDRTARRAVRQAALERAIEESDAAAVADAITDAYVADIVDQDELRDARREARRELAEAKAHEAYIESIVTPPWAWCLDSRDEIEEFQGIVKWMAEHGKKVNVSPDVAKAAQADPRVGEKLTANMLRYLPLLDYVVCKVDCDIAAERYRRECQARAAREALYRERDDERAGRRVALVVLTEAELRDKRPVEVPTIVVVLIQEGKRRLIALRRAYDAWKERMDDLTQPPEVRYSFERYHGKRIDAEYLRVREATEFLARDVARGDWGWIHMLFTKEPLAASIAECFDWILSGGPDAD